MYDKRHLLVQIDKVMDWDYVYSLLKPFYSEDKGRPSLDPLMLVKILIIQYVEGFRSVRFTCKQIDQHLTYRWFLGLSMDDSAPCHSSVSKFLRHRVDQNVWETLFEYVLLQIKKEGFLSPETWAADETELKANANKRKRVKVVRKVVEKEDEYVLQLVNKKRLQHGKKPLDPKSPKEVEKEVICSTTDPMQGYPSNMILVDYSLTMIIGLSTHYTISFSMPTSHRQMCQDIVCSLNASSESNNGSVIHRKISC